MPEELEQWLSMMLETESFEDILERFDLTPEEVFERLFQEGLIDEETVL
jgi:hypothetical protein